MSLSERQAWIIAYDICNERRLQQVHNFLRSRAVWTQFSVFAAFLSGRQIQTTVDGVRARIRAPEDDVRIYPVPAFTDLFLLGARALIQGVTLPDEQVIRWLRR